MSRRLGRLVEWLVARKLHALGLGMAALVLYGWPCFSLLLARVSLLPVNTEQLGFRYFYSLRLLEGRDATVWLPQAQSLTLVHHGFNYALSHWLRVPLSDLRLRTDLFGYGSLAFNLGLIVSAVVFALCSRALTAPDRALVFLFPLLAIYSSCSGLAAIISPDYYATEIGLTTWAAVGFLRAYRLGPPGPAAYVLWGAVLGLAACTKVSLLGIGLVAFAPALVQERPSLRTCGRLAAALATCLGTCALIFLLVYRGNVGATRAALGQIFGYMHNPGAEDGFWYSLGLPGSPRANPGAHYGYAKGILLLWLASLGCLLVFRARANPEHRPSWLLLGGVVGMACLNGVALVKRPAGSTLFECGLFFGATAALLLALVPRNRHSPRLLGSFAAAVGLLVLVNVTTNYRLVVPVARFRALSEAAWQVHETLARYPGPVVVFIPDDSYTGGSVEEALQKGTRDLPHCRDADDGQRIRDAVVPRFSFPHALTDVPDGTLVFWIEKGEGPGLAGNDAELRRYVARQGMELRRWPLATWPWRRRTFHVCGPRERLAALDSRRD